MNHHVIKILPEHYNNVKAGTKTFEIRNNDRAYQKGDGVTLKWFDPTCDSDSHHNQTKYKKLEFKIGDVYPIDDKRVVFSLLPAKQGAGDDENS